VLGNIYTVEENITETKHHKVESCCYTRLDKIRRLKWGQPVWNWMGHNNYWFIL